MGKEAFKLKTVTPKALRIFSDNGLLNNDNAEFVGSATSVYLNPDKLIELCEAAFDEDFSEVDFEEIDLEKVNRGLRDFLQKALGG